MIHSRSFIHESGLLRILACALALGCIHSPQEATGAETNRLRLPEDLSKIFPDPANLKQPKGLTVACYTFPNYHPSALQARLYGPGWTEYVLVTDSTPRRS